ncbi:SWIM zinc finger family protein [Streptomyces olivaceus]|uniref:SWIM zinc finger family protein n=1 Tax=Streptomyces olivaceus TaxID=47716 RepID=UPI001CCCE633|nr:SWIM zinc finger family protein [Streptomyces olivaceus]MBZ6226383.1 SWIM zinc finger family protein [Streptomyces olivaceus]
MTPRPADEARRALREARLRGDTDTDAAPHRDDPAEEAPADAPADAGTDAGTADPEPSQRHVQEPQPRPGDVARAALRGTRTAQRHRETDTGGADAAKAEEDPGTRPAHGDDSRPADVAREALRAARRRAGADAATGVRRDPGTPRRPQAAADSRTAETRARAVRAFAADAFRLPPESDAGEPDAGATDAVKADRDATDTHTPASARVRKALPPGDMPDTGPAGKTPWGKRGPEAEAYEPDAEAPEPEAEDHEPTPQREAPDPAQPCERPHPAPPRGVPDPPPPSEPRPPRNPKAPPPDPATAHHDAVAPHAPSPSHAPSTPHAPPPYPSPSAPSAPPASPRSPRTMAAPGRDGEHRRTFPALPPRPADAGLAGTWWGNAWVTALEEGALDAARLARGRGYAERGHVDAVTVTPGLVLAYVQGSRPRPYRVQVRLRTLGDDDWRRFLDAAVERPGHIAALLDKELPHSLADCGVPLLPGPGDLAPQCSCPDSGHPCKHAAAVCYQTARLLDADPFVLLLLRGRGERELLDALSRLNAARAARAAQERGPAPLPGVRAGAALTGRALPPLPAPLPTPPHPEQPPSYPAAPGGPDPFALDQLATDAAARAHALLATGRDPVGSLTLWQDAVRLAAARPGSGLTAGTRALYASLAGATGRDPAELARAVAAWRQGGPDGLDVLEEPWDPPAGRFDRARPLLLAADLPAFRPWRNHLTHPRGHVQLRLGRTGLWYAYESEPGREDWWPRGTPDPDPVGALTGLGGPGDV